MPPDPSFNNRDSFDQHADNIINQLDDEMDIEMDDQRQNNNGYHQMINSNDENEFVPAADDSDDDEEDDEDEGENEFSFPDNNIQPIVPNLPEIVASSSELVSKLWNEKSSSSPNIELTNEKTQQITQIMSKINLPNVPEWLNELSTENVLDRIKRSRDNDKN